MAAAAYPRPQLQRPQSAAAMGAYEWHGRHWTPARARVTSPLPLMSRYSRSIEPLGRPPQQGPMQNCNVSARHARADEGEPLVPICQSVGVDPAEVDQLAARDGDHGRLAAV